MSRKFKFTNRTFAFLVVSLGVIVFGCQRNADFNRKTNNSQTGAESSTPRADDQNPDETVDRDEDQPNGTVSPTPTQPGIGACSSKDTVLSAGERTTLVFANTASDESYEIVANDGSSGVLEAQSDKSKVVYVAPASIATDKVVKIKAQSSGSDTSKYCSIGITSTNGLGIDGGIAVGLRLPVAKLYSLPRSTTRLPNFASLTPVKTLKFKNINVPVFNFSAGFPGATDLKDYFAILYEFKLTTTVAGNHEFKLISDDGSQVIVNGTLVVNHDGEHPGVNFKTGSINLSAGKHSVSVPFYQGPGPGIAIQFFWKKPGDSDFSIVPASAISLD